MSRETIVNLPVPILPGEPVLIVHAREAGMPSLARRLASRVVNEIEAGKRPAEDVEFADYLKMTAEVAVNWRRANPGIWLDIEAPAAPFLPPAPEEGIVPMTPGELAALRAQFRPMTDSAPPMLEAPAPLGVFTAEHIAAFKALWDGLASKERGQFEVMLTRHTRLERCKNAIRNGLHRVRRFALSQKY